MMAWTDGSGGASDDHNKCCTEWGNNHLDIKVDAVNTAMISLMLTMDTKAQTQKLTSLWLLMVLIGLLSQVVVHAGALQHQKPGTGKETPLATAKLKANNKSKTTATSTTAKPEVDTLSTNSSEFDLDGRRVYRNTQSEQEPHQDNTPALYEILQQQMENVFSSAGLKRQIYNDNSQGKKMTEENAYVPAKPLFPYNINNFNDYIEVGENEEELSEQEDQQTENCEDTEESLSEDDDSKAAPTNQQSNNSQTQQQNMLNSAQVTYHKNKSGQANKPTKGPYDSTIQSNKPVSTSQRLKKPAPQITYPKVSPNQKTDKTSKSHEKPKPPYSNKTSPNTTTVLQTSSTNQHKRKLIHKPYKYPSPISHSNPPTNRTFESNNKPQESHSNSTKPTQTISNVNSSGNSVSPFSTSAVSGSNSGQTRLKRRHLNFRTVASSTQFIATPLADLMLKISIGLAKPSKAGAESNHSQILDKNDIEITS